MNSGLVVAIVACVLTGCSRPSTARDESDAALAANVEVFAAKLAASDEFSGVVLLSRHGQTPFARTLTQGVIRSIELASLKFLEPAMPLSDPSPPTP